MTDRPDPACEALFKLHDSMPPEFRRLSVKYGDTVGVFRLYSMGMSATYADMVLAVAFEGKM